MSSQSSDIRQRSFQFALRVLRVARALPADAAGVSVARQLIRCGTGIGANVEEAQAAHSRRDFARKMNIARGEAIEARYWLRLIVEAELLPAGRMSGIWQEVEELVAILTTIVKRARGTRRTDQDTTDT